MIDLVYIALTIGFFALCVAYVRGLDRIVRSTEETESRATESKK